MVVSNKWTKRLIAGHPVLDFINTLDNRFSTSGPDDQLRRYDDLLDFLRASNLLSLRQARFLQTPDLGPSRERALHRARDFREGLASAFYSLAEGLPASETSLGLQQEFEAARKLLVLKWTSAPNSHAFWDWDVARLNAEWPVSIVAREAESLLVSQDMGSVKQCAHSNCRWLFLDVSRNHSRRWCDMKLCGNRVKASRFQARHADQA